MTTAPKKISIKVWVPVSEKLEKKIDDACLRRDAFLNKLLEVELPHLASEISLSNSPDAQRFVETQLGQLELKPMSLALRPDIVESVNDICAQKRIVRDALFNRIFLLLAASPKTIDGLFFRGVASEWKSALWEEIKDDTSHFEGTIYPLEQSIDPFWAIRTGCALYNETDNTPEDFTNPSSGKTIKIRRDIGGYLRPLDGVYTTFFGDTKINGVSLLGLNCFVPDHHIPGNSAEVAYRKSLDELLENL